MPISQQRSRFEKFDPRAIQHKTTNSYTIEIACDFSSPQWVDGRRRRVRPHALPLSARLTTACAFPLWDRSIVLGTRRRFEAEDFVLDRGPGNGARRDALQS